MKIFRLALALSLGLFGAIAPLACKQNNQPPVQPAIDGHSPESSPSPLPQKSVPKIVAFGDSLTAGLGLNHSESYPSLLQKKLDSDGYRYEVVNAGLSGDTSAGGLRRIDWALDGDVRIVILELGANDLLRGQPVPAMKNNLSGIIARAKLKGAQVLLAGMEAPTNSGPEYRREVHQVYKDLAQDHEVPLIPFILEGVAGIASLNQRDGIHPNAEGAKSWPIPFTNLYNRYWCGESLQRIASQAPRIPIVSQE